MQTSKKGLDLSPTAKFPAVSIILPVLNEETHLADCVVAILSQDYPGNSEVILALGPSTDKTDEVAQSLSRSDKRVRLVANPTGRTAAGLNLAIAASNSPIIVRVDAHAEIPRNYISIAVATLQETGAVNVGGVMAAQGKSLFEKAVALAMRSPLGVGASRFHTGGTAGPSDTVYLGVFLREAIDEVGGFDERFTRAQDWELNHRLREAGGLIYFDPSLEVIYRPRSDFKALAKQYFEYGRWRRVVTRRHEGTVNYRYLAPPFAVLASLFSIILGVVISPLLYIPVAIYLVFLIAASIRIGKSLVQVLILPFILLTMHMSWGVGFLTSPRTLVPNAE
ncbi:unannotated protein [freshwater metagenome]|uniref:Unannotated protein n=1 Tax=freshwater metagenome TaxID=449393 RepID=A0A6J7XYF5_9ZZZZ|nr:glycosyltransferase [Actinomycetota bacterium]